MDVRAFVHDLAQGLRAPSKYHDSSMSKVFRVPKK